MMTIEICGDICRGMCYDGTHNGLEVGQVYERKKGNGWTREIIGFCYVNDNLHVAHKEDHKNGNTFESCCSDSALKKWGKLI